MAPRPLTKAHLDQLTRSMTLGFHKLQRQITQSAERLEKLIEKRIDDLAASVSTGFADVDLRFDKIAARQQALDERISDVDVRVTVSRLERRVSRLEAAVQSKSR